MHYERACVFTSRWMRVRFWQLLAHSKLPTLVIVTAGSACPAHADLNCESL